MQVNDALEASQAVHHDEGGALLLFHKGEGGGGEFIAANGFWRARHAFSGGDIEHVFAALLQQAAKIAIADDAHEVVAINYSGDAQLLAGHFVDHVCHFGTRLDAWYRVSRMHQVLDASQTFAQFAAGMKIRNIFFLESALFSESNR